MFKIPRHPDILHDLNDADQEAEHLDFFRVRRGRLAVVGRWRLARRRRAGRDRRECRPRGQFRRLGKELIPQNRRAFGSQVGLQFGAARAHFNEAGVQVLRHGMPVGTRGAEDMVHGVERGRLRLV